MLTRACKLSLGLMGLLHVSSIYSDGEANNP